MDKKRVNEFGFGGEDDQAVAETDAAKEEEKKTNWFGFLSTIWENFTVDT